MVRCFRSKSHHIYAEHKVCSSIHQGGLLQMCEAYCPRIFVVVNAWMVVSSFYTELSGYVCTSTLDYFL